MTNREKFNQCLLNYVNTIISMEDKELIKIVRHSRWEKWYGQFLKNFSLIYGYHGTIPSEHYDDLELWLTQECIDNAKS